MCKHSPKSGLKRIDPCMRNFIENLNDSGIRTYSSCCGHGKYNMTVVVSVKKSGKYHDLFSNIEIPRKNKFYKKDKEGYYYIPEVEDGRN